MKKMSPALDDNSNVRYGRILQRVLSRYKTLKKVEYVHLLFPNFLVTHYYRRLPR
jgi:hypothetical protein